MAVMAGMTVRRVLLLVENVACLSDYHGREQGLVGQSVPAVELDDGGVVAYVDDRDGEASEYAEALESVTLATLVGGPGTEHRTAGQYARIMRELRQHAAARLLHGRVTGVRT
jgi:hypothetical protein